MRQDNSNLEFIIIDGNSTDGSIEVLRENDKNITFWSSEKDQGVFYAMNKGISKAIGEYRIFMNSGDVFYDENVVANFLKNCSGEDLIYGNAYSIVSGRSSKWKLPNGLTLGNILTSTINHQSIFYSKRICNENERYNTDYKIAADWIFTTNSLIFNKATTKYINCNICICEPPGISENPVDRGLERELYISKSFDSKFISLLKDYSTEKYKLQYIKNRYLVKAALLLHRIKDKIIKR